jgi:hypothetical protein
MVNSEKKPKSYLFSRKKQAEKGLAHKIRRFHQKARLKSNPDFNKDNPSFVRDASSKTPNYTMLDKAITDKFNKRQDAIKRRNEKLWTKS